MVVCRTFAVFSKSFVAPLRCLVGPVQTFHFKLFENYRGTFDFYVPVSVVLLTKCQVPILPVLFKSTVPICVEILSIPTKV